jgi:hypothetical protein
VGSGSSFTCFECDTGADSCKRIIQHKIPNLPFQITGEADHKSMCWLDAEKLCKAHKMDQSKLFKHSTVSMTLNGKSTNIKT